MSDAIKVPDFNDWLICSAVASSVLWLSELTNGLIEGALPDKRRHDAELELKSDSSNKLASEKDHSDPCFSCLGYAYLQASDKDRARQHYRKALAIDPGFGSAKAALEKLGE